MHYEGQTISWFIYEGGTTIISNHTNTVGWSFRHVNLIYSKNLFYENGKNIL